MSVISRYDLAFSHNVFIFLYGANGIAPELTVTFLL
jgi:hypothetical protein